MKKKLLIATANQNKLIEIRKILNQYEVLGLTDIHFTEEIPEPFDTIAENAIYKAQFCYQKTGLNCIAEDSGLEVVALGGAPGAYSARYAGPQKNDSNNIDKLLKELAHFEDKTARFVSVFAYTDGSEVKSFFGEMKGKIISERRGEGGFGYDPIFIADGQTKTNSELTLDEKNAISHRKKALEKLIREIGC